MTESFGAFDAAGAPTLPGRRLAQRVTSANRRSARSLGHVKTNAKAERSSLGLSRQPATRAISRAWFVRLSPAVALNYHHAISAAMAQCLSAMAQRPLGNQERAQTEWTQASQFCAGLPNLERGQLLYPGDWHDGIGAELLRREGERLIQGAASVEGIAAPP